MNGSTNDKMNNFSAILLSEMDQAADDSKFPGWECGQFNALVGLMRVSGYLASTGAGLVFEQVEYSIKEGLIQTSAFCFATFPISDWLIVSEGIYVPYRDLKNPENGEDALQFGEMKVTSREKSFNIHLHKDELVARGYLKPEATAPTSEALLLHVCDVIPKDWLFSEPSYLKRIFDMPEDARLLFVVDKWQHPSFDDLYWEQKKPSTFPDLIAMAEALSSGNNSPQFATQANTSWKEQCGGG